MGGARFRLNLNLQNLSMISIAQKLWDSQDIKHRIKNNFSGHSWDYPDKNWCEISKLAVQYGNSINLPASLSVILQKTILLIGQKIYDWIYYVTKLLGLDFIFTQKIYFSSGVVDEIKIFDLYWIDLMNLDNFVYQSDYFRHSCLFSLACIYGCERFIKERKNEMLDELSEFYPDVKKDEMKKDEIYNIMSVSICLTALESKLDEHVVSPQRMLELCLQFGFSKAARFYWEKLDEVVKVSNLTDFAMKCLRKRNFPSFLLEKYCENLLFLINQMREEERYLFFTDYADEIITLFLPVWPYQELIVDLLKYDWNIDESRLLEMAEFLIWFCERMNLLALPLDNELLFEIMHKAWRNISVDEKLYFLELNARDTSRLFSTLNPEMLNLVFNDPIMTEVDRNEMNSFIKNGFMELVRMGKIDFLNTIIKSIFNYIPEPKEFLKENFSNYKFVIDLMENDESFGFVDQFLDWASESQAERARLKNKINTITVCRSFTDPPCGSFKFELADKFLKWRLESDVEVQSFKEAMKTYNFVIVNFSKYVRIKAGDLSWLRPGDSLVTLPDENLYDNADGFKFLKFEEAIELNQGAVLGIKSFCSDENDDFLGLNGFHTTKRHALVHYVGTNVGDFIVFTVREIWKIKGDLDFNLDEAVKLSNAFIKFYYETDEEVVKFKMTKLHPLVTENLMEFLLDVFAWVMDVSETFLNDFCKFCMIPFEKIEQIKIQRRRDIDNFLDTYLIDQRNFELVDIYLYWLFGEVKRTEVCKKFLNSSNKGALLCVSYLKIQGDSSPLSYSAPRICRSLSLIDDKDKLKNDVFALYDKTPEWFNALLNKSARL